MGIGDLGMGNWGFGGWGETTNPKTQHQQHKNHKKK